MLSLISVKTAADVAYLNKERSQNFDAFSCSIVTSHISTQTAEFFTLDFGE